MSRCREPPQRASADSFVQQTAPLFNDLVGGGEQGRRDLDAEQPSGLQVDNELELCRLNNGRSAGLAPLRVASIDADLTITIHRVACVAQPDRMLTSAPSIVYWCCVCRGTRSSVQTRSPVFLRPPFPGRPPLLIGSRIRATATIISQSPSRTQSSFIIGHHRISIKLWERRQGW
jgi:hypothetical protein